MKYYMATRTNPKPIECYATTLLGAQREAVDNFAGCPPSVPIYVLQLGKHPDWKPGEELLRMYRCYPWSEITEDLWVTRGDVGRELGLEIKHPGVLLREHFMEPRSMTTVGLAAHLGESPEYAKRLLQGQRDITTKDACYLAEALGTSKEFWLNLQRDYDLRMKSDGDT